MRIRCRLYIHACLPACLPACIPTCLPQLPASSELCPTPPLFSRALYTFKVSKHPTKSLNTIPTTSEHGSSTSPSPKKPRAGKSHPHSITHSLTHSLTPSFVFFWFFGGGQKNLPPSLDRYSPHTRTRSSKRLPFTPSFPPQHPLSNKPTNQPTTCSSGKINRGKPHLLLPPPSPFSNTRLLL